MGALRAGCAGVSDLGRAFVSRVFAGGCVCVRVPGVGWNPSDLHGPQSPSIGTKERVAPEPACFALPCTNYSFHAAAFSSPSIAVLHFGGPLVLARLAQWFFSAAFRLRVGAGFSLAGPAWARGGRCLIRKGEELGQAPVRWVGVRWGVGVWKRPS